jgi:uncharacterized membrane protein (DUF2068 family)
MNRPFGATILAILGVEVGLLWMFSSLGAFGLGTFDFLTDLYDASAFYLYVSIATLIIGGITLFLSYGLWHMRPWAWMWMVISQGMGLVVEMIRLFLGGSPSFLSGALVALSISIIAYLLTPGVRAAYLR